MRYQNFKLELPKISDRLQSVRNGSWKYPCIFSSFWKSTEAINPPATPELSPGKYYNFQTYILFSLSLAPFLILLPIWFCFSFRRLVTPTSLYLPSTCQALITKQKNNYLKSLRKKDVFHFCLICSKNHSMLSATVNYVYLNGLIPKV